MRGKILLNIFYGHSENPENPIRGFKKEKDRSHGRLGNNHSDNEISFTLGIVHLFYFGVIFILCELVIELRTFIHYFKILHCSTNSNISVNRVNEYCNSKILLKLYYVHV